jgi:hypothetical protein
MKSQQITVTNAHMRAISGIPWRECPYADASNMSFLASMGYEVILTVNLPYAPSLVLLYRHCNPPIMFPLK